VRIGFLSMLTKGKIVRLAKLEHWKFIESGSD
jgi:hypothetical protein